ncbi:hypothetical protein BO94DRAFT_539214 [Aspergillus sclerotioniger CBS 115572]|uniref:Uncharacterized protein n=1 Tax=Aspergillus sclerotioniger CBS 115572 TaxID=1450535 RepID=A0A317VF75_9EURO|nr:hypothetical protein BO94DRAFT_539214 [Aspergillus sclerotioniger CBS 115572]PWY72535.1 hypothetical protein BO94DRAFT_539214 [Aspergillus sclerotioniger CBS 115572]
MKERGNAIATSTIMLSLSSPESVVTAWSHLPVPARVRPLFPGRLQTIALLSQSLLTPDSTLTDPCCVPFRTYLLLLLH